MARSERTHWYYRGMMRLMFEVAEPSTRGRQFHRVLDTGLLASQRWPVHGIDLSREGAAFAKAHGIGARRACRRTVHPVPRRYV